MTKLDELIKEVRQGRFYIPRDYRTVGGMWTVDIWRRGPVSFKVMDEGYTQQIIAEDLFVTIGYNGTEYTRFEMGGQKQIEKYLKYFIDNPE